MEVILSMLWLKRDFFGKGRPLSCAIIGSSLTVSAAVWGQAPSPDTKEPPPSDTPGADTKETPAEAPTPEAPGDKAEPSKPEAPPKPAPPPEPPPLFTFTLKGFVAGTFYAQDAAFASGNGNGAIFGPNKLNSDKWLLGGDVRQTQLKFMVKGPMVLAAIPSAVVEIDFLGGNQVTSVPGATSVVTVRDSMGNPIGTGTASNTVTGSAMGDESVLPRLRLAFAELNWGEGKDMLRVGQQHNLLIPMIPASASHIGVPLGYGAGQLGWRTPAITYFHKVPLAKEMNLDLGFQINRNSWIDNFPVCGPGQPTPPTANANCLPSGISLGEASTLPQLEARAMLSSGKADSPWAPYYPPNVWQVFIAGHWDQKDLSGVGGTATAPATAPGAPPAPTPRDTMQTLVGEIGFKVKIGPVTAAGNGWYGKNTGGVFGNLLQMQTPDRPDVNGFGAWGQLGFTIVKGLAVWGFAGIDRPDQDQAKAAGFTRLENRQTAGMISYRDGAYAIAVEFLHVSTRNAVPATMTTTAAITNTEGNQPSMSVAYFF
jgi:hypothetical protein